MDEYARRVLEALSYLIFVATTWGLAAVRVSDEEPRLREVEQVAHRHTARQRESWDLGPALSDCKAWVWSPAPGHFIDSQNLQVGKDLGGHLDESSRTGRRPFP